MLINGYEIYITVDQKCVKSHLISNQHFACRWPEGPLNKKDGLTRYGDSHVKDKTS